MSGSQSLQDQSGSALSEGISVASPRPEMPRQNSDPTSDTPGPPPRVTGREERERDRDRDRDRTAWLREEDIPPKVRETEIVILICCTLYEIWYYIRLEQRCLYVVVNFSMMLSLICLVTKWLMYNSAHSDVTELMGIIQFCKV